MKFLALLMATLSVECAAVNGAIFIDTNSYHLRSGATAEWEEFAGKTPHGKRLDLRFNAQRNSGEATLLLRQHNVKLDWAVELNGRKLKSLFLMEEPLVWHMAIPPGTLRSGANTLSVIPPKENDDIVVSDFRIEPRPAAELLSDSAVEITVTDLPSRITVTDARGYLVALLPGVAVRPGVAYTADGKAKLGLMPGEYTVFASRGFEYNLVTQRVVLTKAKTTTVQFQLRREVATPGLVAADTHIHSFTYAKHGDATIEERMLTLAGEGIELPISTEHNMLVDFTQHATRAGVSAYFTPVIGCEVTTKAGHFNVFPIAAGSTVPDHNLTDWPKLMQSIRATPGVQVAILNHPRDVHSGFIPFAETNLNPITGENLRGFEFTFDGVELINSGALRSDLMQVYSNWFALLNFGYRFVGVGASDSHDVSRFIVGQGRTYIRCNDADPGKLDVEEAMSNLRRGRASVSLGLLPLLRVDERFEPGDLAKPSSDELRVDVTVLGPSWVKADRLELFQNGLKLREQTSIELNKSITWAIRRPLHDAHLIAIASGPGVTSPHWAIPRPYQASSQKWNPRVFGSTNPVWVDADNDGQFTSSRGYAQRLIKKLGPEPSKLLPALKEYDATVAIQAASLCRAAGKDIQSAEFHKVLKDTAEAVRSGFEAYTKNLQIR